MRLSAASTVIRAVSIASTMPISGIAASSAQSTGAEPAARDHARAERGELPPEQERSRPARASSPTTPPTSGVDRDRALEDARDLAVGAAEQVDDLDRLAVRAERAARREPHRRGAGRGEQHDQARPRAIAASAIASNTGASQPACASSRAEGTDAVSDARSCLEPPRGRPARQPHVDQRRHRDRVLLGHAAAGRATARAALRARRRARGGPRPRPRDCASTRDRDFGLARALGRAALDDLHGQPAGDLGAGVARRGCASARPGAGGHHGQRDHDRDDPRHRPGEPRLRHQAAALAAEARDVAPDRATAAALTARRASRRGG